jgi:type I restriction enzyme S subunit
MHSAWITAKLGTVARVVASNVDKHVHEDEIPVRLCNYLDVYKNRRLSKPYEFSRGSVTQMEVDRFTVKKGDVLITKDSETPDDIGVPCLIADDFENTVCGYHLALIRAGDGLNPSFLSYLFQGEATRRYFLAKAAGLTRFGLNARTIGGLLIPMPSADEQSAIATVLDAVECAIVNARGVIGKAEHLQKGLMQQLLTGRVKPDGSVRPRSDFYEGKKLGFVPKGWTECRVRHLATKVTDGDHVTPKRVPKGFYLLSARNVGDGRLLLGDVDYVDEPELRRIRKRCDPEPNDLLISCSGTIGNACLVPEGMQCTLVRSAALVKFQPKKCNPKFMEWLFRATPMQRQMQVAASVSIQGNLFQGSIRRLWLMLPEDVDEQAAITAKLTAVERLILAKEQKIFALQRLKTSLMQNLLTGRIRLPVNGEAKEATA